MTKFRFGKAFPNQLDKVRTKYQHISDKKRQSGDWQDNLISGTDLSFETPAVSEWRKFLIAIVLIVIGGVFFARLFHLQIVEGKDNRELADSNRIQVKVIHAQRGVIYDRNGRILAQNEPGFRLLSSESPAKKARIVLREEALKMEVNSDPQFRHLEVDSIRAYPLSEKTAHILGYVSEITENELKEPNFKNYKLGDRIGRGGVEETYEKFLKGIDGGEIVEVDAGGKSIRTLRRTEPIPGQNLHLTIDSQLQEIAFTTLEEHLKKSSSCCGAFIAQDPSTGQILALVSYPSFNPKDISDALVAENSPLLNRAIGGVYPPGSTFKVVSSLAGLSSGKIKPDTKFEDTGVMNLGTFSFSNWYFTQYGQKEVGGVDVVKALKRSNDIYFYQLGSLTGEKIIGETAKKMGLGKRLGIDIPGEVSGLIPDNAWKKQQIGEIWYPGDTLHMAIGQGYLLTTPLQISNLISIVASHGKQFPPHLALKITDSHEKTIKDYHFDALAGFEFKSQDMDLVTEGLKQVPKVGGTAWPFFNFPIETAGKTGTAEFGHPKDKTHAWYMAYAPVNKPRIAAAVLMEAGGEGSTNASPIVKEVFRYYFSNDKKNLIKDLSPIVATASAAPIGD